MISDGPGSGGPPVVQYWHQKEAPSEIVRLTNTFRERNPELRHLLFSRADAEALIAERFTAREVAAFRACAVPAMQADYFRYCAVHALGGVYSDVDFVCLRPLRELVDSTDGGLLFRREPPGYLLNGFFLFGTPGHPLLRLTLEIATANIERRVAERVQMVTGPWIFSSLAALHQLGSSEQGRREIAKGGLGALMEPFRELAANRVPTPGARLDIEAMANVLFETVGEYARVSAAFEGVAIAPLEIAEGWIGEPEAPPSYQQGEAHWINWQNAGSTIFR